MKNIKQLLRSIFFIYCITFFNGIYSSSNPYNYATPAYTFLNNSSATISGTFYLNSTTYSYFGPLEPGTLASPPYVGAGYVQVAYNGYTITIYASNYQYNSLALFSSGSITNQSSSNVSINFYNTAYSTTPMNSSQFALNANQSTYFFYGSNQVTIYDSNNNPIITNYPISPFANYNLNYTNGSWSLDLASVNYTFTNNGSFNLSNLYFYTNDYPKSGFLNDMPISINSNNFSYLPAYSGYFAANSSNNSFLFIPVPNNGSTSYALFDTGTIINNSSSTISVYYYDSSFFNYNTNTYNTITLSSEPTAITSQESAATFYGCNQITIYDSNNAPTNIANYTISSSQNYVVNYSNGTWSITVANTLTNNNTTEPMSNLIFYDDANSPISSAISLNAEANTTIALNTTSVQGTMYGSNITLPVTSTASSNIFDSGFLTNDSGQYAYVTFYDASQTAINSTPIEYWPDATLPIFTGTQYLTIYNSSLVAQVTMTPISASDNYYIYIATNAGSAWYLSSQQNTTYTLTNNNTVSQNFTNLIFYDSSNNPITTAVTLAPNDSILIPNNATYYTGTANGSLCTINLPTSITSNVNIFSTTTDYNYITNNSGQTVYLNFYTSNGTLMNTPAIEMTDAQVIQTLTNAVNVAVYTDASAENNVIPSTPILSEIYYENGIWFLSKNALSSYYFTNNSNQTITNLIFYDDSSIISSPVTLATSAEIKIPNHTTTVQATYFNATITLAISYSQDWDICDSGSITNDSGLQLYFNFYNGSTLLNNTLIAVPNESTIDILTGTTNITVTDGGSQTVSSTITPTQDYWINQSDNVYYITGTAPTSYIFTNNETAAISNLNFHQSSGTVISSASTVNAGQALIIPDTAAYITGTLTSYNLLLPLAYPTQSSSTTLINGSALYNTTTQYCYVNFYDTTFSATALTTPFFGIAENNNTPIFYGTNQITVYDQNGNPQITNASIISSGTYYINNNGSSNNIWSLSTTEPTTYVVNNNSNTQITNLIFYNSANQAVSIATTLPAQSTVITPSTATYVKGSYNGNELTITLNSSANTDIFASGTITNNSGITLYLNFYTDNTINTTTLLNQSPIAATNNSVTAILSGATNIAIYQNSSGTQLLTSGTITSDTINYYINNTNGTYYVSGTTLTSNTFTNNANSAITNITFFQDATEIAFVPTLTISDYVQIPTSTTSIQSLFPTSVSGTQVNAIITQTIPTPMPAQNYLCAAGALINNTSSLLYINFYTSSTTLNNTTLINSDPIELAVGALIQTFTNTASIQILDSNLNIVGSGTINEDNNYYINYNGSTYYATATGSSGNILTNNSSQNQTITNLTFYNGTSPISSPVTLTAGTNIAIPTNSTSVQGVVYGQTIKETFSNPLSSSNFFGSGLITNNTGSTLYFNFYSSSTTITTSTLINTSGTISVANAAVIQIPTSTLYANIYSDPGTTLIASGKVNTAQNYYINVYNGINYLTATPLLSATITNNSTSQTLSNVYFLEGSTAISSSFNLAPTTAIKVPTNATTMSGTVYSGVFQLSVADSNVFASGSCTNSSGSQIYINFYDASENLLTPTPFTIANNSSVEILTGTAFITVYYPNQQTPVLTLQPITNTSDDYYINNDIDNNNSWYISITTNTAYTLTNNNSNLQPMVGLLFYNNSNDQLTFPAITLNGQISITTPSSAKYIQGTIFGSFVTVDVSTSQASDIFGSGIITNKANSTVYLNFYTSSDVLINETPIQLPYNQTIPNFHGTAYLSVYSDAAAENALITNATIASANTSYYIYNDQNLWYLTRNTETAYTFTNNSNPFASLTNTIFYNSSNTALSSSLTLGSEQNNIVIPGGSAYVQGSIYASLITLPITTQSNWTLAASGLITNNSGSSLDMTFYDETSVINSTPIELLANDAMLIFTDSTNITIADTDVDQEPINQDQNYYINNYNNIKYISATAPSSQYLLTNNSTTVSVENLYFENSNNQEISSATTLPAGSSIEIPQNSTNAIATINSSQVTTPITNANNNSNIFGQGFITNTSGQTITINFSNTNGVMNNPSYSINNNSSIQNFQTATTITIFYNSSQVLTAPINANTSYYINFNNGIWYVTTQSITNYTFTNNGSLSFTNVVFLNSQYQTISSTIASLAASASVQIPSNATFAQGTYNGTLLTIPLNSPLSSSYAFASGSITNNSGYTLYANFYDNTINTTTPINATLITLANNSTTAIIAQTTNITLYQSNQGTNQIISSSIDNTQDYFINNSNGIYYISGTAITSSTVTNNSAQQLTSVTFFDNSTQISTPTTVTENNAIGMPTGSTTIKATVFNAIVTQTVSTAASSDFFGTGTLINNTSDSLYIDFYNNSTLLNSAPIAFFGTNTTLPIFTTTTNITILNEELQPVGSGTISSSNTSYYLNYNSGTQEYYVTAAPISTAQISNNSANTITNVAFFNSSGQQISSPVTLSPYTYTPIVSNAATVQGTVYSSTITEIVSTSTSSNFFAPGSITNNSGTTLSVSFYNNSNIINTPAITITNGSTILIPTGTTYVVMYNSSQGINISSSINQNNNYFINDYNGIYYATGTALTTATLTNNSNQQLTNVTFFSNNTQISSPITLNANVTVAIPTNATSATGNISGGTFTFNVTTTPNTNTNLFGSQVITNNSNTSLSIYMYNSSNELITTTPLTVNANISVPMFINAATINVFANNIEEFVQTPINPNTPYYINFNNNLWYITTTNISTYSLINNSTQTLTNLLFTNSSVTSVTLYQNDQIYIPFGVTTATATLDGATITITPITSTQSYTIFGTGELINNTGQTTGVIYFNGTQQLNTVPMQFIDNATFYILASATDMTIYDSSNTTEFSTAISSNDTYYINDDSGTWYATNYPLTTQLFTVTNNANPTQSLNQFLFLNNTQTPISTPALTLLAGSSLLLPGNTSYSQAQAFSPAVSITEITSNASSSNFFASGLIYNQTSGNVYINFYNGSTLVNSSPITLTTTTPIQIINGTTSVTILNSQSQILLTQNINQSTTYYLTASSGVYFLSSTTPSTSTFVNNSTQTMTNVICYNNSQALSQAVTLQAGQSLTIPTTTNNIQGTIFGSAVTLSITLTGTPTTFNVVSLTNRIVNCSTETIYVNYYTNSSGGTLINTTPIAIAANNFFANPLLNAQGFAIIDADGTTLIAQTSIATNNFIYNTIPTTNTWQLSTTIGPVFILINNSAQTISGPINCYDANNNLLQSTPTLYPYGTTTSGQPFYIEIPYTTVSITIAGITYSSAAYTLLINQIAPMNIFTGYVIENNSGVALNIETFNNNTSVYNNVNNNSYLPIVNQTNAIQVFAQNTTTPPLSDKTSIAANSSYQISTSYAITTYNAALFFNNYPLTANSVTFFTSSGSQTGTAITLNPNSAMLMPTNAALVQFTYSNTPTNVYNTIDFTQSLASSANPFSVCTNSIITNNSGSSVLIECQSSATNNNIINSFNLASGQSAQIPTTTAAFVINNTTFTIDANTNYSYTAQNNVQAVTLLNNSQETANNVLFYNTISEQISDLISLPAKDYLNIVTTATSVSASVGNAQFTIPVSDTTPSTILSSYTITNSSSPTIQINFYDSNGDLINSSPFTLAQNESMPFINGTAQVTIVGTNIIQQPINDYSFYFAVYVSGTTWSLQTQAPASTSVFVNNNATENATNVQFFNNEQTPLSNPTSLDADDSIAIPVTTTYATLTDFNVTMTSPASTTIPTNNLFTNYTISNTSTQTITVTFYGIINGSSQPVALNNPGITIAAQSFMAIPTGTSQIFVTVGNNTAIPQTSITSTNSYFVNQSSSGTWTLTTTPPSTSPNLTNNFNANGTDLIFLSSNQNPIGQTQANFQAYTSALIPSTATYAQVEAFDATITLPITATTSSNLYTNFVIYNNASETIGFICWQNSTTQLNDPTIDLLPSQNGPIITGTIYISIYDENNNLVINQQSISSSNSYIVDNIDNIWTLTPATASLANLINNVNPLTYNPSPTATNIIFYNQTNQQQGNTISSLAAYKSTAIPQTTTSATFNDLNTSITIPLVDSIPSGLFANEIIVNDTGEQIQIVYQGLVNGITQNLNTNLIQLPTGLSSSILTGAQTFSIYNSTGTIEINNYAITPPNTSYTINSNWTVSPSSATIFTNNTAQTASSVTFFNNNTPISTPATVAAGAQIQITPGATQVKCTQIFNTATTQLTLPIVDTISSTLTDGYLLFNNSSENITISMYGTINSTPNSIMNYPTIQLTPGSSTPILTGATAISVYDVNDTLVLNQVTIAQNSNYYVNDINSVWSLNTYAAIVALTNNYSQSATNLEFFNSSNIQINTTQATFAAQSSTPIPTTATTANMQDLGTSLTIPVSGNTTSSVFGTGLIINSSSQDPIGLVFYGTLNNIANQPFNTPAITQNSNVTLPIPYGATSVAVYAPSTNNTPQATLTIPSYNSSYYITNTDGVWQLNQYQSTSTLTNNYNLSASNVTFQDSSGSNISQTPVTTFGAYQTIPVPTTATTASMTDFNVPVTIPVSTTAANNMFTGYTITNNSAYTVTIKFYGTVNGVTDTAFITSGQAISMPTLAVQPMFNATTSLQVLYNNSVVIDTSISLNPLPLNVSYDIQFNGSSWQLVPASLNFINNYNDTAYAVTFYDTTGTILDSTALNPWAVTTIPTGAVQVNVQYQNSGYSLNLPLSSNISAKLFTNNSLNNNSDVDTLVVFYATVNGVANTILNETPFLLQNGDFLPLPDVGSSDNLQVSIIVQGQAVIDHADINPNQSYTITQAPTRKIALKAANSDLSVSSTALAVVRLLGGDSSSQTKLASPTANIYGFNPNLFRQFFYVDAYTQMISELTARQATLQAISAVFANYQASYNQQPDFNYVTYGYLMNSQLIAAQQTLVTSYPSSEDQINLCFEYLLRRIEILGVQIPA